MLPTVLYPKFGVYNFRLSIWLPCSNFHKDSIVTIICYYGLPYVIAIENITNEKFIHLINLTTVSSQLKVKYVEISGLYMLLFAETLKSIHSKKEKKLQQKRKTTGSILPEHLS